MTGRTVVITGASSGIGLEASVQIARMGADLVIVARDEPKGDAALAEIMRRSGSSRVSLMLCDLSSFDAVRDLAARLHGRLDRIDVLVNNAGTVSATRRTTKDGLELTFAVNHLAAFLLTNLITPLLEKSRGARIVNVSSVAHWRGDIDFENLQFEHGGYSTMRAYSRSKLANVLFTMELTRRFKESRVTSNCLHPGAVATNIWGHAPWYVRPLLSLATLFMLSAKDAAGTIVYLTGSQDVEGRSGGYYEKNRLAKPSPQSQDAQLAARLWEVSRQLTSL